MFHSPATQHLSSCGLLPHSSVSMMLRDKTNDGKQDVLSLNKGTHQQPKVFSRRAKSKVMAGNILTRESVQEPSTLLIKFHCCRMGIQEKTMIAACVSSNHLRLHLRPHLRCVVPPARPMTRRNFNSNLLTKPWLTGCVTGSAPIAASVF